MTRAIVFLFKAWLLAALVSPVLFVGGLFVWGLWLHGGLW